MKITSYQRYVYFLCREGRNEPAHLVIDVSDNEISVATVFSRPESRSGQKTSFWPLIYKANVNLFPVL